MTTEDPGFSRRTILRTAAGVVVATAAGTACGMATSTFASAAVSRRALLHLTPTTGWPATPNARTTLVVNSSSHASRPPRLQDQEGGDLRPRPTKSLSPT